MHRIDGVGHLANMFTEGDPGLGQPATRITKDWLNAVQEELSGVVLGAGLALDKPNNAQVLAALRALYGYRAEVTLTAAEMIALFTTPKTLVAAPGAGKAIVLLGAGLFLDYNSVAYNGIAAGEDLAFKYTDASGAQVAQVETTGFLDQTSDQFRWVYPTTTAQINPAANAPLVLHMLVGNIATGDSPLKVRVHYRVIDVSW